MPRQSRYWTILPATMIAGFFYGCAAEPDSGLQATAPSNLTAPSTEAEPRGEVVAQAGSPPLAIQEGAVTMVDARPAALVNGETVSWGQLRPILNEAAGALALREILLDQRLAVLTAEAGITISEREIDAEQRQLVESLNENANTALRLLEELRTRQGLGPVRFRMLMKRNAALRALVADRVSVDEAATRRMYDAMYGPRRQARLITVPDLASAHAAIVAVKDGAAFGDIATERSTDLSAARGGLLEPMSREDTSYPASLRAAVWRLRGPGDMSNPVLLDDNYAVVQLVREVDAANKSFSSERRRMETLVRMNQERAFMDQLAKRIIADANVTIFDDSLRDSWQRSRRR